MARNPAITEAFENGDHERFKRLLVVHPEFLRSRDGSDRWMWRAAAAGRLRILEVLHELGMDVNEAHTAVKEADDPYYEPEGPILHAARDGQLDVVRWLLERGAQINFVVRGKTRCLPLLDAAKNGHLAIVKLLVEHGADLHAVWNRVNAVTEADHWGQWEVRDYLRSLGARDLRETTPPDFAAAHQKLIDRMVDQRGPLGTWTFPIDGDPPVTIHWIPSSDKFPYQTLFTTGLGDKNLPQGRREFASTELQCLLPADWPPPDAALADVKYNWPYQWMETLVREFCAADRWPEPPVMRFNGEPPEPLAPSTEFTGWLMLKMLGESIEAQDYRIIDVHSLIPIYSDEREAILKDDEFDLIARFQAGQLPLHVEVSRSRFDLSRRP